MKTNRHKILFIYCICLILVLLSGCQMKKQVDVGSEFSDSSEDINSEILTVDNSKGDIEKLVEKFLGMTTDEAVRNGADYKKDEDYFQYIKGVIELTYFGNTMEGLGPVILYRDEYEMAAEQYTTAIGWLVGSHSINIFDYGVRKVLTEENIDNCTKEEVLNYCNPYAELLGYNSENSEVEVYALTLDKLSNTEVTSYGPFKGINNKEMISIEEQFEIEENYPWSKEYEALYVVYKPHINGLLLDSYYCSLQLVYVPIYGKVVYALGQIPWTVKEKVSAVSLISKEDAISETMLINNITDKNNITVDNVSLVYSMELSHLQEDSELDLCWKVDYKIENSIQYSGTDAYKTTLINAVTGEKCILFPE